mmetsp:Transcript_30032/g.115303  ORF Transcript_30032/g.115303 Transcript_30032/m.115303 type:complete len:215 (-) Transcript_30032:407-1051(-)|eukprot:CAMPEP_0113961278 /NCGR_PEP_ID=MMETSP0011_2-20120614/5216_1 /TAXON_ID=101924 /ORGANISM="Rhodosorus marinus" /LENGTH=214 /DNA_ID=CAMNT_0000972893 /DNA_START=130 /DNA_END=774 /DNA_ORIENTATION=+ /assembly_acc=CAM_ASM_000156
MAFVSGISVGGRVKRTRDICVEVATNSSGTEKIDAAASLKNELLNVCERTRGNGTVETEETKNSIAKIAAELDEAWSVQGVNPATDGVGMIDGSWYLQYTSTVNPSSGKLGPFVGRVLQKIDLENHRFENMCLLGPLKFNLEATWKVLDDNNFNVLFLTKEISLFGISVQKSPFPEGSGGFWRMGYTDEDVRVLWTKRFPRDKTESLFVLRKER